MYQTLQYSDVNCTRLDSTTTFSLTGCQDGLKRTCVPGPTVSPTARPTKAPISPPTYIAGSPTLVPTASPTQRPTKAPTFLPTFKAGSPTPRPTLRPTFNPTPVPSSFRPTPSSSVTVAVSQSINGLNANDFNSADKIKTNGRMIVLAIVATINSQTTWNLVETDVRIISVSAGRRLSATSRKLLASSVSVDYQVTAASSQLSSNQVQAQMSSIITTSSNNGDLATNLQTAYSEIQTTYTGAYNGGALQVADPSVTVVAVYTPSPTRSPTPSPSPAPSSEKKSLVSKSLKSLGALAVLCLIPIAALMYIYRASLFSACTAKGAKHDAKFHSVPVTQEASETTQEVPSGRHVVSL